MVTQIVAITPARASESGVGSYRPGEVDLFARTLPGRGGVLIKNYFLFQDASLTVQPNNAPVRVHARTITYTDATFVTYTAPWRFGSANWGLAVIAQTRIADQKMKTTVTGGPTSSQQSTVGGFGDLIVSPLMLNWNFSKFHLVGALMFYAPTGSYDAAASSTSG